MEYANTISGLKARRLEIMQKADELRAEASKLMNDKISIEQVLASLGCNDFQNVPRVYTITFERGQLQRFICDFIRERGPSMTRHITLAIIEEQGRDPKDRAYYSKIQQAVSRCLAHMADKGNAVRDRSAGTLAYTWRLPD